MGASVSRLLSTSKASNASSDRVPYQTGRLELVIAASGHSTWAKSMENIR